MRLRPVLFTTASIPLAFVGLVGFDLARPPLRAPVTSGVDRIVVEKAAHRMVLLKEGGVVRVYRVAIGRGGSGAKRRSGDNKVPEGAYRIAGRKPDSAYHLALRIGYPTPEQAQAARRRGEDPGGDIMIHGIRNGLGWVGGAHRLLDWTQGCIAVTDSEIEEIWRLVPDGAVIEIRA